MKNLKYLQMQLRMVQDVLNWIFNPINAAIIATVVGFKDAATLAKSQSNTVNDLFAQYVKILKGIAQARRDARTALAQQSYIIMQAARAYFIKIGDTVSAAEMDIALSTLSKMAYNKFSQKIASVQSTISPVVAGLAPYNITPASFAAWQQSLTDFNTLASAHAAIAQRKAIGTQIDAEMQTLMNTLRDQCDTTVVSITDEQFVETYFNNRRLVNEGIRHTGAHVQLQNEVGEPFGPQINVTVDGFTKNGRTFKAVSALTDDSGIADPSSFEPGERTITVSGPGVVSKTFGPFIFEKAKILSLTLTCQPQFTNIPAAKTTTEEKQQVEK